MIEGINDLIAANRRRFAMGIAAFLVFTAMVGAVAGRGAGIVVGVVVGLLIAAASYLLSDRIALASAKARPLPTGGHARLHNIVEGLCAAAGLPKPSLYLVEDRVPNAFAVGRNPEHASVVVTTGLLERMSRVELEAVVAHELAHIRNGDILLTSTAVGLMFLRGFLPPRRETEADVLGVRITRYPPGLIAALEKMRRERRGARGPRSGSWATAHLWIDAPNPPLDQRLAELREL